MSGAVRPGLEAPAAVFVLIAYSSLAHHCNMHHLGTAGAALAVAPLLIVGLSLVWRCARPMIALPSTLAALLLLYHGWPRLQQNFPVIYLVQDCGMYGLLGLGFARSLGPGATALCTRFADQLHGPLTPAEVRYTRQVTAAWAAFFSVLALTILALFVLAPLSVWSLVVNFLVLPLVAFMFIAEYAVRRWRLPETHPRGVLAGVKVFWSSRSRS